MPCDTVDKTSTCRVTSASIANNDNVTCHAVSSRLLTDAPVSSRLLTDAPVSSRLLTDAPVSSRFLTDVPIIIALSNISNRWPTLTCCVVKILRKLSNWAVHINLWYLLPLTACWSQAELLCYLWRGVRGWMFSVNTKTEMAAWVTET